MPGVLLFTGKGGVGKTTAAAGTAVLAARQGRKTLILSTDPAHSLADAFGQLLGGEPTPVEGVDGLEALQVDTQQAFERSWQTIAEFLGEVMTRSGIDPLAAEELTVLPGAAEVLALLAVQEQVASGRHDLVVVDCAPTAETLRLLALPEALSWYLDRIFPIERRVVGSLRPLLSRSMKANLPDDRVFEAVARLSEQLADVRTLLADPQRTAVRLVLTPEAVVLAEARRTLTSLSLFGYRVDAVIANRIFPASTEPWLAGWATAQAERLAEAATSFAGLPLLTVPFAAAEPVGVDALGQLGADLYGVADPVDLPGGTQPMRIEQTVDGYALCLDLPFLDRSALQLSRHGDELSITAAGYRRVIALPSGLRRCTVEGAALRDGVLRIAFVPDPSLWMGPR